MSALFCWKESALFAVVKTHLARERHKIVKFWSYTKVPLLANAPSLSNTSAASADRFP
jgi:hypothetical protein